MKTEEKPLVPSEESAPVPATLPDKWPDILDHFPRSITIAEGEGELVGRSFMETFVAWLTKSASAATQKAYARDVALFMRFVGIDVNRLDRLTQVRPFTVAAWRDHLRDRGLAPASIGRKITVLRSLFTYLQGRGKGVGSR